VGCKLPTHSFYKHLVKHKVTKMRDILSEARETIRSRSIQETRTRRPSPPIAPSTATKSCHSA